MIPGWYRYSVTMRCADSGSIKVEQVSAMSVLEATRTAQGRLIPNCGPGYWRVIMVKED